MIDIALVVDAVTVLVKCALITLDAKIITVKGATGQKEQKVICNQQNDEEQERKNRNKNIALFHKTHLYFLMRQEDGENASSKGKISSLPSSIAKDSSHLLKTPYSA